MVTGIGFSVEFEVCDEFKEVSSGVDVDFATSIDSTVLFCFVSSFWFWLHLCVQSESYFTFFLFSLSLIVIENFPSSSFVYLHSGLRASSLTQTVVITCPSSFSFPMNSTLSSALSLQRGQPEQEALTGLYLLFSLGTDFTQN